MESISFFLRTEDANGGGDVPEEGEVGQLIVSDLSEEVVLQVQHLKLTQPVQRPASDLEKIYIQRRNNFFCHP
jgi:hypothetical protein